MTEIVPWLVIGVVAAALHNGEEQSGNQTRKVWKGGS
jgi:hypothetical protein